MTKDKLDWANMPSDVAYVFCAQISGMPIGAGLYEKTVRNNPKWFPKEYDRYMKYDAIPKEVHDNYIKELFDFREELWKDEPKNGGGIEAAINGDESYKKWSEAYDRLLPIQEAKEKELHKKYYEKYGI